MVYRPGKKRNRRSKAAKKRTRKAVHTCSRGTFLGFENSPLKSPPLADQRRRRVKEKAGASESPAPLSSDMNDEAVAAECLAVETEFPALDAPSPCSSSSSSRSRGRPKSSLGNLTVKNRQDRLKKLKTPPYVLSSLRKWYGVEYHLRNLRDYFIDLELNIFDLTSVIWYKANIVPQQHLSLVLHDEADLLSFFDRLHYSHVCEGILSSIKFLDDKGICLDGMKLLRSDQTIALVRKVANNKIQYVSLSCQVLLQDSEIPCSSCRQLQISVNTRSEHPRICVDSDHSDCQRFSNLPFEQSHSWTPFLQEYFNELIQRKRVSTRPWPAAILVFSLSMLTRLGTTAYDILRNSLPLPSTSTLRQLCSRLPAKPGILPNAIGAFCNREPNSCVCISFDEIYFTQGLQLVKHGKIFRIVGMTTYGSWETDDDATYRYFFSFSEETNLHPDLPSPSLGEDLIAGRSWMTEEEASQILTHPPSEPAKMALHFLLSSVSSTTSQAIGFVETCSVKAALMKALLFQIISIIIDYGKKMPHCQTPCSGPETVPQPSSNPWQRFRFFSDDWFQDTIEMPSLDPSSRNHVLRLSPQVVPHSCCPTVVAISFDGSSHARAMVKQISFDLDGARYFEHPHCPSQKIFCISDPVHLFKRFRNNILKSKILLAPDPKRLEEVTAHGFPDYKSDPDVFTSTFSPELYRRLISIDADCCLSISSLSNAAVDLTPRSKMSFPLAKRLFHPRTLMSLDALERQLMADCEHTGAYLAFSAKAVTSFANRFLCRLRSNAVLTGEHRFRAAEQLYQLWLQFDQWGRRNLDFFVALKLAFPDRNFAIPTSKRNTFIWGFFDNQFIFDMRMTLVGLSMLCLSVPQINLRLITSDCAESFFSSIRACAGAGGQLNAKTHRYSARKAMILRLNLHSYIGDMIEREQPVINAIFCRSKTASTSTALPAPEWQVDVLPNPKSITDRERAVMDYVSGWMLHKLLKVYPENDLLKTWKQDNVRGLTRCTDAFNDLISLMFFSCHHCYQRNRSFLLTREDCHELLAQRLIADHPKQLSEMFGSDTALIFSIAFKLSGLLIVDKVKSQKKENQKSFRNSLS